MRESVSGPVRQNFTRKKMVELLGRERIGTFVIVIPALPRLPQLLLRLTQWCRLERL